MITIKPIASSSAGNCTWISDGITPLLLDCGIPLKRIKQACDFKLHEVGACLLSHEHGDHSKAFKDLLRLVSVPVILSKGTADALDVRHEEFIWPLRIVKAMDCFQFGTWKIIPFDTVHDCAEPLGYLLKSDRYQVLWATDTAYLKYRFAGLTHIIIECNYDMEILNRSVADGEIGWGQKERIMATHFGLDNVLEFLAANDLSLVEAIHLVHLSSQNANEELMARKVKEQTGKPVYVAAK